MPNKKLKINDEEMPADNSDSDKSIDSDDMSDSDESNVDGEEVMINFEARALHESDADTISLLMKQKLGAFAVDLNEVATILVQQEKIGNVIYQAEEDGEEELDVEDQTLFGVVSSINFCSDPAKKFVDSFKQFLLKECQKHNNKETLNKFEDLIRTKNISYLINERYMNIPPAISLPMFESLKKDLEDIVDENNNIKSDYWLLITKHFIEKEEQTENIIYGNAEEEVLTEFSDLKFEIRAGAKKTHRNEFNNEMTQVINVVMLPLENVDKCIEKIKALAAK